MSNSRPGLEAGEEAVLRSLEQESTDSLARGSSDALRRRSPARIPAAESADAPRRTSARASASAKFSRIVRKVMVEQENIKSAAPGHSRSRSNAQVYDLLKTLKQPSEAALDDVFQQDALYEDGWTAASTREAADPLDTVGPDAKGHDGFDPLVPDVEQVVPANDTTPLLTREASAVRRFQQQLKQGRSCCDGASVRAFLVGLLAHLWMVVFAALLAGLALLFYYPLGNPKIDAIGKAGLSWYCNFFARQIVLFEVARVTQYLLLDSLILGTYAVRYVGPFFTLLALQTKGWPFIVAVWGILDCCLLQGNNAFQNHWLYATGWEVYSIKANSGLRLLASEPYLRMLLCMVVAGVATTLKRTIVAISFGRRQYGTFKPRLEKLLLDVVLLNEVATLSAQADLVHVELAGSSGASGRPNKKKGLQDVTWNSVKLENAEVDEDEEEDPSDHGDGRHAIHRSSSSGSFLKSLLDRWEEPIQIDKGTATIEDVLRFRRALAFMDQVYPFGEDFGAASNRDEAIMSAEDVYRKLRKINTYDNRLPFDVLAIVALGEDDTYDKVKKRSLRRLFHPDKDGALTLLAFVQSCDSLYRRLRYFLATVNNSASLDKVLENVLNSIYYFILALFLLSLMNYNAWGLLVSITSLLVSFSFAFGSTVSKYVQGIILIAVTRPFDLGDRIFLTSANDAERGLEQAANGWFVEDITLSTTKLRFARTGEVMYLANNLLCDMRLYNCNRSPNASVVVLPVVHIRVLEKDNLKKFEEALRKFVYDRPRMWSELLAVIIYRIDSDNEQVYIQVVLRHRESWQKTARIYMDRAELLQYIHHLTIRQGIMFETPPPRRVIYMGGQLQNGTTSLYDASDSPMGHRTDLLRPHNVRSSSEASPLLVGK